MNAALLAKISRPCNSAGRWECRWCATLATAFGSCARTCRRAPRGAFYVPKSRIVVLHGFIKKTQKTPPEDKALALKRKNAHIKAEESQEPS
jgi:Gp49-like protein DUF891